MAKGKSNKSLEPTSAMWYEVMDDLPINRLEFNFLPSWWYRNYGIEFGEKIIFDPDYRTEVTRFMRRAIHERFGNMYMGEESPGIPVTIPNFANAITPAAAGFEMVYPKDAYVKHVPNTFRARDIKFDRELENAFPFNLIFEQVKYLNSKYNMDVPPSLNNTGVLNDCLMLLGDQYFEDMVDENEDYRYLTQEVFEHICTKLEYNRRNGVKSVQMIPNCAMIMLSPDHYVENFMDYDIKIYELMDRLGMPKLMHHCGKFDKYGPKYRGITKHLNAIEIGTGSDIRLAASLFPESEIMYILGTTWMLNSTTEEVKAEMERLMEEIRPFKERVSFNCADMEYGTPEDNLLQVYECIKRG